MNNNNNRRIINKKGSRINRRRKRKWKFRSMIFLLTYGMILSWILRQYYRVNNHLWVVNKKNQYHDDTSSSSSLSSPTATTATNSTTTTTTTTCIRVVKYVGEFGLGHRLSKLSAAYHFAAGFDVLRKDVNHFDHDWGVCRRYANTNTEKDGGNDVDIFTYLFGTNTWDIKEGRNDNVMNNNVKTKTKTIVIRNDVHGYYAGQSYKNARYPISNKKKMKDYMMIQHWFRKMESDLKLFNRLLSSFQYRNEIDEFQKLHTWSQRQVVIGLHVRLGNGELEHFQQANRSIQQQIPTFLHNVLKLICDHLLPATMQQQQQQQQQVDLLPPLIFLATDTAEYIPLIQDYTERNCNKNGNIGGGIQTVVETQQARVQPGQGVSFNVKRGQECLDGWKYSWIDMSLLASSDIIVASSRSTFTQILPRSIVMDSNTNNRNNKMKKTIRWPYCEVAATVASSSSTTTTTAATTTGDDNDNNHSNNIVMTCFEDDETWLFRNSLSKMRTFTLSNNNNNDTTGTQNQQAIHKVMVHLPDIFQPPIRKIQQAMDFLQDNSDNNEKNNNKVFIYGKRFDPKYRGKQYTYQEEWTWANNATTLTAAT